MPYQKPKLSQNEIDLLTKWIDQGATILAGCCRTRPSHIEEMTERLSKK